VLVPSRSEEAFPYAGLDALADGVPVLASEYGGLPELVGPESVVPAGDVAAWSDRLRHLWQSSEARQELGTTALQRVRAMFSEDAYHERLMAIYAAADAAAALRRG
jgi:glycosyltransferase involved in cell wall biosynthesis